MAPAQLDAPHLSRTDALLVVAGTGLISHLIFKRFEPSRPAALFLLLVIVPILLSVILLPHFSTIYIGIANAFATYLSTLSLSVIIYRLSPWHPLAKFPGPIPNKLSKLWMAYISSKGRQHLYYKALHDKYGTYVRIGPNELSIREADAVLPVLGAAGLPKGPFWDGRIPPDTDRSLIQLRDPQEHAARRRLWNKGFTTQALKDYEVIISKRGKQLIQALEKRQGVVVDIATWMNYFAFDFMGDIAFGGGFELMRDGGDKEGVLRVLEEGLAPLVPIAHIPWSTHYSFRFGSGLNNLLFRDFSKTCAQRRLESGSLTPDLFFYLFEQEKLAESISVSRITSEATLAIGAGSDTTSTVLSNIWYFLLRNPAYFERLHAEVDTVFPDGTEPFDTAKLASMPCMNAVINESLRLLPPVASGAQRSVLQGTGGKVIGNRFIPEGTQAFVHTYSLHRDPRYFSPAPETFWPDRWMSPEQRIYPPAIFNTNNCTSNEVKRPEVITNHDAFIPFSFGPAMCVGKKLAMQEMRMVMALVTQRFDMQLADPGKLEQYEEQYEDWFVAKVGSIPVVLKARI